jgi:hypothetical protein
VSEQFGRFERPALLVSGLDDTRLDEHEDVLNLFKDKKVYGRRSRGNAEAAQLSPVRDIQSGGYARTPGLPHPEGATISKL